MAEPENGVSHRHSRKHGLGSYCKSLTCNSASSRPSPRSVDGNYKHARSTNLSSFPMVILILQHPDIYTKAAKIASKALQHVITDHTELFGGNGSRGTWGLLFRSFALLQKSKTSVSSRMEDWLPLHLCFCLPAFIQPNSTVPCHMYYNFPHALQNL